MIVKSKNVKQKEFKGVIFDVLAVGQNSMITKMHYKDNEKVPFHSHPNEQSGFVVSGSYRIKIDDGDEIIHSGDSYSIPANTQHSFEVLEPGIVIDFFTPIRKDYL